MRVENTINYPSTHISLGFERHQLTAFTPRSYLSILKGISSLKFAFKLIKFALELSLKLRFKLQRFKICVLSGSDLKIALKLHQLKFVISLH